LWAIGQIITNFLFIPFLGNSPKGQAEQQIFALDDPNDAASYKDVPFWGLVDTATNSGGQITPKPQFWRRE